MPGMEENTAAMSNRSLRTIRTELEFLTDLSVITPQQLSSIFSQLPNQTHLHAPLLSTSTSNGIPASPAAQPPVHDLANTHSNEKQNGYYPPPQSPAPAQAPPPPAYAPAPAGPPPLAMASAIYAYQPTDTGDLALMPNDRIAVLEWMNADWAKGRNERTGQEGIFPRSYVNIMEKEPPNAGSANYGNMPLDVSQTGSNKPEAGQPSKFNEQGKKFGKKMGNAAIFGAGATIGSNIVNSVF